MFIFENTFLNITIVDLKQLIPMENMRFILAIFVISVLFGALIGISIVINYKHKVDYYDSLTGLLNLNGFYHECKKFRKQYPDEKILILRGNILRFRTINSVFGKDVADKLLVDIGEVLTDALKDVKDSSKICRVGADDFMVIISDKCFNQAMFDEHVLSKAEKLIPSHDVIMQFGICIVENEEESWSKIFDRALEAVASIKEFRDRRWVYYDETLKKRKYEKESIIESLQYGLNENEFEVYYQPQYDYTDGTICGAEALVRWNHSKLGPLSPGKFIKILEENGFIYDLDKFVWKRAFSDLREFKNLGLPIPHISVNISRGDIFKRDIKEYLLSLLDEFSLQPIDVHLEITETSFIENPEVLMDFMSEMHSVGFFIEMDDFGSGYSSLNALKRSDFDLVKLDMGFLEDYGNSRKAGSILSSTVHMIHQIKIPIIAEGVETIREADFLKSIGCKYMQGYFFRRPLEKKKFMDVLANSEGMSKVSKRFDDSFYEDFLNINNSEGLLFSRFANGAAVLERSEKSVRIVRINEKLYKEFDFDFTIWSGRASNLDEILDRDSFRLFLGNMDESIIERKEIAKKSQVKLYGKKYMVDFGLTYLGTNAGSQYFYLCAKNITEQYNNERTAKMLTVQRAIESQYAGLNKAICYYDVADKKLTLTGAYAKLHGVDPELRNFPAAGGKFTDSCVDDISKAKLLSFFNELDKGLSNITNETCFVLPNSEKVWERASAIMIYDDEGLPLRAVITIEDITTEKYKSEEKSKPVKLNSEEAEANKFIVNQVKFFDNCRSPIVGIENMLDAIGRYSEADTVFICKNKGNTFGTDYLRISDKLYDADELRSILPEVLSENICEILIEGNGTVINDLISLLDVDEDMKRKMIELNIRSIIVQPMVKDGKVEAIMGVTNARKTDPGLVQTAMLVLSKVIAPAVLEKF